ncbi:hypothetical protein GGI07_001425 [Coemansia sp. Benny D115]|nr:hypothetical protein GGI07_001425 [Coemansia sp. Benny D115]
MAATGVTTVNHIRKLMQVVKSRGGFDALCFSDMKILSAEVGHVRGEIPITKSYLNAIGGTHGGWLSTLVDTGGSLAVASQGYMTTGVSTDISISFLAASGEGNSVIFDAKVLKMGKTLAYTRVDIYSGEKLVATGNHTKFVAKETSQGNKQSQE